MSALHLKYRPIDFASVIGQGGVVSSLKRVLESHLRPHTFLFSGPSGVGKTTIARIIADMLKCEVVEVDAATYTGIDDMRAITENLHFKSWNKDKPNKCVILDECHALSRQSWQSLLKIVEEPPSHVYFCFCTTDIGKVPNTIVTRAHHYNLIPVMPRTIEEHLSKVCKKEKLKVDEAILEWISRNSQGSVRQALVMLSMCFSAQSVEDAKTIVAKSVDGAEAVDLARLLISGRASWPECVSLVSKMEQSKEGGVSYEALRITILNYTGAVLAKTKDKNKAILLLSILEAFSTPLYKATEKASFLLALGTCVLAS